MNIDKLIHNSGTDYRITGFGSLMNIDKLIPHPFDLPSSERFGSLMNIDKLIPSISYRGVENPFWLSDEY